MSVWASSQGQNATNGGDNITVYQYYTTVNTDASGIVVIDLSSIDVAEVLDVSITPVITGVTTIVESLIVAIQDVTTTTIKALIGKPNNNTVTVGAVIAPIVAVGAGRPCRCRVIYRKG